MNAEALKRLLGDHAAEVTELCLAGNGVRRPPLNSYSRARRARGAAKGAAP